MKSDTDDTIRVTVTFRRESHPEWYETLIDIRSGRARAEIVRAALALPRARPASSTGRSPAISTPKPKPLEKPELKAESTNDITAATSSTEASFPLRRVAAKSETAQQPVEGGNAGDTPRKSIRRGGMADELLDMGL